MKNDIETTLEITNINADWRAVKNRCRTTMGKDATDNEATKGFIKKILISEHSPIRLVTISFAWKNLKSWIATHFARHHIGWEKWISTQRNDRTNVDRDKSPQDTPVKMDVCANAQGLINVSRFRLCFMAHKETREKMEGLKYAIKESGQEEIANVMQKNCIYRCGCPEFESCGYWQAFCEKHKDENLLDIQTRYDLADKDFYEAYSKKKDNSAIEWQNKATELEKENSELKHQLSKANNTLDSLSDENKALKKLKNVRVYNERNAGRKKNPNLEREYLAIAIDIVRLRNLGISNKQMLEEGMITKINPKTKKIEPISPTTFYRCLKLYAEKEKELGILENRISIHNERGAGRKKDSYLDAYLLSCWDKKMTSKEIIGSEYDSFNGKKKVSRASYYRAKKRLYDKNFSNK